jgi:lysophospholipase L1-like esterase
LAAACGSTPTGPTTTAPQIVCPANVTVRGVTGSSQPATYPAATVSGGATPVTVTCNPASGSTFPLGGTAVSCTASDAQARQATCSFNVTLTAAALSVTKFDTFGDSLTEGENGRLAFLDSPNAYPTKLQTLFDTTYPGQGIQVINHGVSGWPIERTVEELRDELVVDRPGGALFLSGYNNLYNDCGNGSANTNACQNAIRTIEIGIRDCIHRSKDFSVSYIFISTLTPQGPVLPGAARDRRISNDAIVQANARIRQVVAAEGAILVDNYPVFLGHEAEYVDTDGLHLRPAGYQALADSFFAAIKATVPANPFFIGSR